MNAQDGDRLSNPPGRFPLVMVYSLPLAVLLIQLTLGLPLALTAAAIEISAFIAILYFHRRPEFRRWKYEAIVAGVWSFGLDSMVGPEASRLIVPWLFAPVLANVATITTHHRLWAKRDDPQLAEKRASNLYLGTHRAFASIGSLACLASMFYFSSRGWTTGILLVLFLLLIFVLRRFLAGEALTRFPVIYLRAFSSTNVFRTFNKIVAPAISDVHVIVGLTPAGERKKLVKNSVGLSTASLYVVPDEEWQKWVQTELKRAHAVVFDFSVATENLDWEFSEAMRICAPGRIASLVAGGVQTTAYPGTQHIPLNQSRAARRKLRAWLLSIPQSSPALPLSIPRT